MSDIRVVLHDGTTLVFPDGTPDAVIDKAAKEQTLAANIRAAGPATGVGGRGNYTQEMGMLGVGGNQALNVLEGMGVDPSSPILGTAKNVLSGARSLLGQVRGATDPRIQDVAPLARTAGSMVAAPVLSGIEAGRYAATGEGDPESAARSAGTFAMTAPAAYGLAKKTVGSVAQKTARDLYGRALKPQTALPAASRERIITTGLEKKIPVSGKGYEKLTTDVTAANRQVSDAIASGAGKGVTISPVNAASRVRDIVPKFRETVDPAGAMTEITGTTKRFLSGHMTPAQPAAPPRPGLILDPSGNPASTVPGRAAVPPREIPIPADRAQSIKVNTMKALSKDYGKLSSAATETQKQIVRGLKEELAAKIPEIAEPNALESVLLELEPHLRRAVARSENANTIGLGTPVTAVEGTILSGSRAVGAASGLLKSIIDNPAMKSRIAIILANNLPGKTALAKKTTAALIVNRLAEEGARP